jgi:hypothetical protein
VATTTPSGSIYLVADLVAPQSQDGASRRRASML